MPHKFGRLLTTDNSVKGLKEFNEELALPFASGRLDVMYWNFPFLCKFLIFFACILRNVGGYNVFLEY
jgi:hypothetical protein